jgi:hypothetical protein
MMTKLFRLLLALGVVGLTLAGPLASAATIVDDARTNFWYQFGDGWPEYRLTNGWPVLTSQNNWEYGWSFSTNGNFDLSGAAFDFIPMPASIYHDSVPFWGHSDPSSQVQIGGKPGNGTAMRLRPRLTTATAAHSVRFFTPPPALAQPMAALAMARLVPMMANWRSCAGRPPPTAI